MREKSEPSERQWPAALTEMRPIASLTLRETNPRAHSLEQIEQISASMRRFGWTMPVLIDESGVILAGHGRVRAARLMGKTEAPCVIARGWTEEEKQAYVITDNQLAANSEWDRKRLGGELRKLVAADFDMTLIGFGDDELSALVIDTKKPGAEDAEPEDVHMKRCPTCGSLRRATDP
jgi:ParB-like chromosome segregation protein Spo0J